MKGLLTAIQTHLRTSMTYMRDKDIYITPHENYIPAGVRFPCVGIKDGDIDGTDCMGGGKESRMKVTIVPFVQLAKAEATIMGDAATGKKGILDVSDDIMGALNKNLLGISGLESASCKKSTGSETFGDDEEALQRKLITAIYEKKE